MNKEEFEKYFEKLEKIYTVICDNWWEFNLDEDERKQEIKQILEEIYQKGQTDKFIFRKRP